MAEACPGLDAIAVVSTLGEGASAGARDWASLSISRPVEAPGFDPNTPWMIMFTSGTTGKPKGTVHIHGGFPFRVAHDTAYQFDFRPGDRLLLKISGRRAGPTEIEEAALSEGRVATAAAIGVPDAKSGQAVVLLVVPKPGVVDDGKWAETLREHVAYKLGAGLRPREVLVVPDLPRTRNGKVLRRLARGVILGESLGDLSTLENPSSLDSLRTAAGARPRP